MFKYLFNKIKKILFYKTYLVKRRIGLIFNINQNIKIGGKKIILPPGHLLSLYNVTHRKYDAFLPMVIKNIKYNESIIDVGANVGDTLLRCINANNKPNYYSIEADKYFFGYLKKNKEIFEKDMQQKITIINELVGENLEGNLSKTTHGTKSLIESSNGTKTKPLDEIINDYQIQNLKLIKVDVDGYDYNVLLSGIKEIKKSKPDLFFEYINRNKLSYVKLIEELSKIGYSSWTIFNLYGFMIFENKTYSDVIKFMDSEETNNNNIDIFCKINA